MQTIRRLGQILARCGRREPIVILGVMIAVSAMESVGVGMLFPILNVVQNPSIVDTNKYLSWFSDVIGTEDHIDFSIALMVAFIALFVLKNALSVLLTYLQMRFAVGNSAVMSASLLRSYVAAPYHFHIDRDATDAMVIINQLVVQAFSNFVLPAFALATEVLATIAILAVLLLLAPKVTLYAALALGIGMALFYIIFRERFRRYGEESIAVAKHALASLRDALSSVKEAKVYGVEEYFCRRYEVLQHQNARLMVAIDTLNIIPRALIETVAIFSLALIVIVILLNHGDAESLLAVFGIFALAALRLLPAANKVLYNLNKIRFSGPQVDEILGEIERFGDYAFFTRALDTRAPADGRSGVALEGVNYAYPGTALQTLQDVTFRAKTGEIVGIVGPSGAGKTTIANIILGLLQPDLGDVRVMGVKLDAANPVPWRQVGYVPQTVHINNCSMRENIAFGVPPDQIDDNIVMQAIRSAQLEKVIFDLPEGIGTIMGEGGVKLSGGQRQRGAIARALYFDPDVLVMDEATSALDNETEVDISQSIRSLAGSKTIVIIAHRQTTIEQCDKIIFVNDGRIDGYGEFSALLEANPAFKKMILASANDQVE